MALTRAEEKRQWEIMAEPKPSYETYKDMMPKYGCNPLAVRIAWSTNMRCYQARAFNNHHQEL